MQYIIKYLQNKYITSLEEVTIFIFLWTVPLNGITIFCQSSIYIYLNIFKTQSRHWRKSHDMTFQNTLTHRRHQAHINLLRLFIILNINCSHLSPVSPVSPLVYLTSLDIHASHLTTKATAWTKRPLFERVSRWMNATSVMAAQVCCRFDKSWSSAGVHAAYPLFTRPTCTFCVGRRLISERETMEWTDYER